MCIKVYCDSNIFIDYFDERQDKIRPLKDFAFEFFSRGWNCEFKLVISDWLIEELERHLEKNQMDEIFNAFKNKEKLIFVKEEKQDKENAKKISKHWDDALHAILANRAKADYLATRNIRHYEGCDKLVNVQLPETI